jgi:hypothetical protein
VKVPITNCLVISRKTDRLSATRRIVDENISRFAQAFNRLDGKRHKIEVKVSRRDVEVTGSVRMCCPQLTANEHSRTQDGRRVSRCHAGQLGRIAKPVFIDG